MTPQQLRTSWLVVSGSDKRGVLGERKSKTAKGRTPLGDKGLGRLGTMKLGDILLVETATSTEVDVATAQFRWADCERATTVDEIPVRFRTVPNIASFKGTKVSVLGLNDMAEWSRPTRVEEIANSLARLVSPFEATSTFPVKVTVDGKERSLVSVTDDILARAVARFDFRWEAGEDGNMNLIALARLQKKLLAPTRTDDQKRKAELVFGGDNEAAFLATLRAPNRFKGYTEKRFGEPGHWYVELERRFAWSDMVLDSGASIEDPGPFVGSFYFFHLTRKDDQDAASTAGYGINSALIKGLTGIAILRDGFRVRSQGDWLGLSSEMTSGSTYGLRVDNTIGYFLMTGEHNYRLVEKSDREGFVEDAVYRGFLQIARRSSAFASDAMDVVRRSFDQFARKRDDEGKEKLVRPGAPIKAVEDNLRVAKEAKSLADRTAGDLKRDIDALEREVVDAGDVDRTAARAIEIAKTAHRAIDTVRSTLVSEPGEALTFLKREFEDRREQADALFESAAVGLSARGLAHEMRTHLSEIRQRSSAIQAALKKGGNEGSVLPHLRAIRGACDAISNAAALIDPMLPRSRMLRETFKVTDFVNEYFVNRSLTFEHAGIRAEITSISEGAVVRTNRARLLQVLDNLVNNSRYWLRRGALTKEAMGPKLIRVEVGADGFVVSDSGPGVALNIEDRLFEIFVSGRPAEGGGQGIGLYIASNLLSMDGCFLSLLPDRNEFGRRYRFAVNLSNVVIAP